MVNLNKYKLTGTYWRALNVNGNSVTYYDNFVVQYIPKWVIKTENKSI